MLATETNVNIHIPVFYHSESLFIIVARILLQWPQDYYPIVVHILHGPWDILL